jgi:hypothetical protein
VRSNTTRIALAVGGIAALVVLFVVLNGGSDDNKSTNTSTAGKPSTKTQTEAPPPVVTVRGGKPAGGIKKLSFTKGDQVRFRVDSDVADEIHVHGYDFHKDVPAGGSVSFSFPAKIEGVFVVELESRGEQIAQLTVKPA